MAKYMNKGLLWNLTEAPPNKTMSPPALSSSSKFTMHSSAVMALMPLFFVISESVLAAAQSSELPLSYHWG